MREAGLSFTSAAKVFSFGPYRLYPAQQLLLEGDDPVRLGSRALEVLIALVERAGELVSKDDLIARVWPNTTVEESNIKVHIAALRRALADGQDGNRYIVTVPGRGYCFVCPTVQVGGARAAPPIAKLAEQLPLHRFLTIVGTGGVGTTSVALALAEKLLPAYEDGVWLVELASLADSRSVPNALIATLGLEPRADDLVGGLVVALRDKHMLLVFDNCERVIDQAADLAVAILKGAPGVHILATSREALRSEGEQVYRLQPLESPPVTTDLSAAEALAFPAVQLFVERATASMGEFSLSDADAPIVADICTKLDGVPLAIEFAAARVDAFGVAGVASHLDDRLCLLTSGRRTALPRHQTMRATLDWSYDALSESERQVLRRLGIFACAFSLKAAIEVVRTGDVADASIADCLANLVAKSLVAADVGGPIVLYRLLETTRVYAREKLVESGGLSLVAPRHAEYCRQKCDETAAEWEIKPEAENLATSRRIVDETRAALEWAFSPSGDASMGAALTVAIAPLWFRLSLMMEARDRVERALASIGPNADPRMEMRLFAALGASLLFTAGKSRTRVAWKRTLELADRLKDRDCQLQALWGLWVDQMTNGDYRCALSCARRFLDAAGSNADAPELAAADRLIGTTLHYLGDQAEARLHLERTLYRYQPTRRHSILIRLPLDQRLAASAILARIRWLQGYPDEAMRIAAETIERARALDHPWSLCFVLAGAGCPIALFVGDLGVAEKWVAMLLDRATAHDLAHWRAWGRMFEGALAARRGDAVTGLQLLCNAQSEFREIRYTFPGVTFLGEQALCLARAGRVPEAVETIDQALQRSDQIEERWCIADLLRVKGDLMLAEGNQASVHVAEDLFSQSLAWARQQGTMSWELRTATSLARLRRDQGRRREGHALLAAVYERFSEGFETADLRVAKQLIHELA